MQFHTYPTGIIHPHIPRHNRWIMKNVNAELEEFEDPEDYIEVS